MQENVRVTPSDQVDDVFPEGTFKNFSRISRDEAVSSSHVLDIQVGGDTVALATLAYNDDVGQMCVREVEVLETERGKGLGGSLLNEAFSLTAQAEGREVLFTGFTGYGKHFHSTINRLQSEYDGLKVYSF